MLVKITKITALLGLALSFSSHAANLVQFQAGQTARAADVNANFNALNSELAGLKSFNNLTNEQISALKAALQSKGLRWVDQAVDCTNNPKALMDLYAAEGAGLVYMSLKLKGDCHANLSQQFHGLTLSLYADPAEPARLLPDGTSWAVGGSFNGGLYLNNLTLLPPANSTAVLYSRVSQGSVDNTIIEGGANGVIIQAGAQAYIFNTQIKNTQSNGIRVMSGGNLRLFHTLPNTKVVDTTRGNGIAAEQAEIGIGSSISVKAPLAFQVTANGSIAQTVSQTPNRITAEGNVSLATDAQFHAQELVFTGNLNVHQAKITTSYLEVLGNVNLNDSASAFSQALKIEGQTFMAASNLTVNNNSDITGKINAGRGSSLILKKGVLRALNPSSMDYQQAIALELNDGSTAFFGDYRDPANASDPAAFVINGQLNMSQATFNTEWAAVNGGISAESTKVRLNNSVLNAPGRSENDLNPVSLNSNSALVLRNSDVFTNGLNAASSVMTASDADFGSSKLNFSQGATADLSNCVGSGHINLDSSRVNLNNCQMGDSTMYAGLGSSARIYGGQIGVVHIDLGANVSMSYMTLTGNGQMPWGDQNYHVGPNAMMTLQAVTLNKTKHFHIDGVLRITDNSALSNSTLFCGSRGYTQWWNQTAATLASIGSCPAP